MTFYQAQLKGVTDYGQSTEVIGLSGLSQGRGPDEAVVSGEKKYGCRQESFASQTPVNESILTSYAM